jgi:hypothetical protein
MSTGPVSSAPGCLVPCKFSLFSLPQSHLIRFPGPVEDQIANAKSSAEAALKAIENAQNALQVVGPLEGPVCRPANGAPA